MSFGGGSEAFLRHLKAFLRSLGGIREVFQKNFEGVSEPFQRYFGTFWRHFGCVLMDFGALDVLDAFGWLWNHLTTLDIIEHL